ncbi:hypothetical protein NSP_820 [Nodularia spumigena CCY9414]|nr:hypothetical protein NSP_820 [Nodularia spumigena CCY9414]
MAVYLIRHNFKMLWRGKSQTILDFRFWILDLESRGLRIFD